MLWYWSCATHKKIIRRSKHHKYFLTFYFLQYDSSQFTGFVDGYLENLLSNMIRCSDQNLKNSKSYVWYRDAIIIHTYLCYNIIEYLGTKLEVQVLILCSKIYVQMFWDNISEFYLYEEKKVWQFCKTFLNTFSL